MGLRVHLSAGRQADKMRIQKAKRVFLANHREQHLQAAAELRAEADSREAEMDYLLKNQSGMAGVEIPKDVQQQMRNHITNLRAQAIEHENGNCMGNHA